MNSLTSRATAATTYRFVLLLGICASPAWAQPAASGGAADFQALLADAWDFDLREDPLSATRVGDTRFNDQLPEISIQDSVRRANAKREFQRRWQAIDPEELSASDQINHAMFGRDLSDELAEFEFKSYLMPITNREGFHIRFPDLATNSPLNNTQDFENYIARLRGFKRYADQHIAVMRVGILEGYTLPAVVLEGYQEPIEVHLVKDPEESLFFAPFRDFPGAVPPSERARLREEAKDAILRGIGPGYEAFLNFMRDEYVPRARDSLGASALPNGRAYYRFRVHKFTTLDVSPEEVHATGLREVARIRGEMQDVIEQAKFAGDFAEFLAYLRTDERFYAKSSAELMKETAAVLKRMDGLLPKLFKTLPRTPYGIREIPAFIAPRTTSAYYMPPTGDGTTAGFYYVNTYQLASRPLYGIQALSLHEAVPGHHLQLALQQEMRDLPEFRRYSNVTVFIEGWALYAERLGLEVGFYEDPYNNFGRLSYEIWRACRLVVDTGIHYLGWSREQAVRFMEENSGLSAHNIRAEVDRYIAWPGQALAYKTGELKIRELRALAEDSLGSKFNLRDFHEVVLGSGAVPLDVLEKQVLGYIQATNQQE